MKTILHIFIIFTAMAFETYSLSAKIIVSCVGDSITFGAAINDLGKILHDREKPCNGM
jgi:hypothetical protein